MHESDRLERRWALISPSIARLTGTETHAARDSRCAAASAFWPLPRQSEGLNRDRRRGRPLEAGRGPKTNAWLDRRVDGTRAALLTAPPPFFDRYWPVLLLVLGAGSVLWPYLALPAAFATSIGLIALPRPGASDLPRTGWWLAAGTLASAIGMFRFVILAMPGIVGGGRMAVEQEAVSRLRDVSFAQDAMRRAGWIDPDRDGVGSAASLSELCGGPALRGQAERSTPVLHCGDLVPTALGPAARSGAYLYTVCLPALGGGWSAWGASVDEEAAERHFVAFAWPDASPFDSAFSIDQHENIRVVPLRASASAPAVPGSPAPDFAASCSAALDVLPWQVWRGKKPRTELPGDHPEPGSP